MRIRTAVRFAVTGSFALLLAACIIGARPPSGANLASGVTDGKAVGGPIWSPDGKELAFTVFDPNFGVGEIFIRNLVTNEARRILEAEDASALAWSPDGKQIAYNCVREICAVDAQGASPPVVLASGQVAAWSPDGKQLAIFDIATEDPWSYDLKLQDVETGIEHTVLTGLVSEIIDDLAWSPDGTRLAFSLTRGEEARIDNPTNVYIYDPQASTLMPVTSGDNDFHPTWSANGKQIAYLHLEPGSAKPSVMISQVANDCKTEVPGIKGVWSIAWSPDGRQLAYSQPSGIYLLDLAAVFGENFLTTGPTCASATQATATP